MTSTKPVGMSLLRTAWVKVNRLQTGVVQFHSSMNDGISLLYRIASATPLNKPQIACSTACIGHDMDYVI